MNTNNNNECEFERVAFIFPTGLHRDNSLTIIENINQSFQSEAILRRQLVTHFDCFLSLFNDQCQIHSVIFPASNKNDQTSRKLLRIK